MNSIESWLHRRFRKLETDVHELNYLFWECTLRCNLHCIHCGSDCTLDSGHQDMPMEDFLHAFDTIPKEELQHRFTVVLTGGEPLMRKDICQIGMELRKRKVGWGMVSNGQLYTQEMHQRLMAAGMGALTISLDGMDEDHDWMRGRTGTFNRTIEAISIAAKEQRLNFDVVTCVNQRNLPHLQEIHDLLASLGVPQWRIFTIIPIGRAKDYPELHLTDSQYVELMEFIKHKREVKESAMNVTYSCEGYLGKYERKVRQNPYFCHAGINIASVLIDGTISACPNIDRNAFGQGNIYKDNFYEVWQTRFEPFRNREWARRGKCKDCKAFKNCLGNGMHNWHDDCREVINCHYEKIRES